MQMKIWRKIRESGRGEQRDVEKRGFTVDRRRKLTKKQSLFFGLNPQYPILLSRIDYIWSHFEI